MCQNPLSPSRSSSGQACPYPTGLPFTSAMTISEDGSRLDRLSYSFASSSSVWMLSTPSAFQLTIPTDDITEKSDLSLNRLKASPSILGAPLTSIIPGITSQQWLRGATMG